MKVTVEPLSSIQAVTIAAAETQGIEPKRITPKTWLRWLRAEHSIIRNYLIGVRLEGIPYYVSVHLVRHKVGVEHFVRSQRPSSLNPVDYDRKKAPQDSLVNHFMVLNPQALINISQVRLCSRADEATRSVWEEVYFAIKDHVNPYISVIAKVMMPRCEYRGGVCYELGGCGMSPHYSEFT